MSIPPVYQPTHFYADRASDRAALQALTAANPHLIVLDHIRLMLSELIKTRNPNQVIQEAELQARVDAFLEGYPGDTYGVWVYYPWLQRVVRILPKAAFIELRTSRNQYKILPEEQERLGNKKVGIVGLSVGQSVAVTMAQERCCGVIRLADFDVLELSNMNRIRSGVHEIGELKVVNTAREILEIDPYLEVEIFPEGLLKSNMQDFFTKNGPLDLVIDECDSLDIKLLLREKAKQLRIPVLMDTSDRGMLDIELFDQEPDRPVLHGFVGDLKADELQSLTTEEKIPHILKIVGVRTMSERMKVSMMEVEQTIKTWPQLASGVVLGGGVTCDVARRLLLQYGFQSGRYFVDLEEIIPDRRPKTPASATISADAFPYRLFQELPDSAHMPTTPVNENALHLDQTVLTALVRDAVQAPSGGNMQSWIWRWSGRKLYLWLDVSRTVKLVDYQALGTLSGLGAAAESLVLAAHARGFHVRLSTFPKPDFPELVATFEFYDQPQDGCEPHKNDDLYAFLYQRQCNRRKVSVGVPSEKLEQIRAFVSADQYFKLHLLEDNTAIGKVGKIAGIIDRQRLTNKSYHEELVHEIRWSAEEAETQKDGIDLNLIDLNPLEKTGFQMAKQWSLMSQVAQLKGGGAIEKMARDLLSKDTALGLISTPEISPVAYFNGGRFYQRLWLYSTKIGVDWHPMPAMLYAFLRLEHGQGVGMTPEMQSEVGELKHQFSHIFPMPAGAGGILLFRLVPSAELPLASYRRPVEAGGLILDA